MDKGTAKGEFLLHAAGQRSGAALAERFYLPVNVAHQIIILLDGSMKTVAKKFRFSSTVKSG